MNRKIFSIAIIIISFSLKAQLPNHHWSKSIDGGALAKGYCITTDNSGNVYTAGVFGSTSDFDPSSGVFNLTSNGSDDIFIVKTNAQGDFLWARNLGGTQADVPTKITCDLSGNIYLTGYFAGIADFNPESGTSNLISAGGNDVFITKLNSLGQLVWAKNIGGSTDDVGNSIDIDDYDGSVFIVGDYSGAIDLDPGMTAANVTSNGALDIFMLKLASNGDYITSKSFGGTSLDRGRDIVIDVITGDQFITGSFGNTVDFDPGIGFSNLVGGSQDIFVLKLNLNNNFVFAKRMGGIAVDEGRNIDIDDNGFIYINGSFISTCNFDPDGGTVNVTSNGNDDVFVVQLSPSGSLSWVKTFGSIGTEDFMDMDVSSIGDIYITGEMANDMDANPDLLIVNNLLKLGAEDTYIISLASDGSFKWATSYGSNAIGDYTRGFGVFTDDINNVYITGSFHHTVDFNPSASLSILSAVAGSDIWFQKLGPGYNAIDELTKNSLSVFPNPSNGNFTLRGKVGETVELFSQTGVLIESFEFNANSIEINCKSLSDGMYFLRSSDSNKIEKLIIKK